VSGDDVENAALGKANADYGEAIVDARNVEAAIDAGSLGEAGCA